MYTTSPGTERGREPGGGPAGTPAGPPGSQERLENRRFLVHNTVSRSRRTETAPPRSGRITGTNTDEPSRRAHRGGRAIKEENVAAIGKNEHANTEYTPEFLELERRKRYGYANKVEETAESYKIKMFFPTIVPPGPLADKLGLPREMPDYEYDISLEGKSLIVKGRLRDENILKLTGIVNSFPDRFFKEFILDKQVDRYESDYKDKILYITAYKAAATA